MACFNWFAAPNPPQPPASAVITQALLPPPGRLVRLGTEGPYLPEPLKQMSPEEKRLERMLEKVQRFIDRAWPYLGGGKFSEEGFRNWLNVLNMFQSGAYFEIAEIYSKAPSEEAAIRIDTMLSSLEEAALGKEEGISLNPRHDPSAWTIERKVLDRPTFLADKYVRHRLDEYQQQVSSPQEAKCIPVLGGLFSVIVDGNGHLYCPGKRLEMARKDSVTQLIKMVSVQSKKHSFIWICPRAVGRNVKRVLMKESQILAELEGKKGIVQQPDFRLIDPSEGIFIKDYPQTLKSAIRRIADFEGIKSQLNLMKSVADGLLALYDKGYCCHGDIKAVNIFLDRDQLGNSVTFMGRLQYAEKMGLPCFNGEKKKQLSIIDPVDYLPPEICSMMIQMAKKSAPGIKPSSIHELSTEMTLSLIDVWALGILFYQILYGKHPYLEDLQAQNADDFSYQVVEKLGSLEGQQTLPWFKKFDAMGRIGELGRIGYLIQGMLSPDPGSRPQIAEICERLEKIIEKKPDIVVCRSHSSGAISQTTLSSSRGSSPQSGSQLGDTHHPSRTNRSTEARRRAFPPFTFTQNGKPVAMTPFPVIGKTVGRRGARHLSLDFQGEGFQKEGKLPPLPPKSPTPLVREEVARVEVMGEEEMREEVTREEVTREEVVYDGSNASSSKLETSYTSHE